MKYYWAIFTIITVMAGSTVGAGILNGDFDANTSNWASKYGQSPVDWFSSLAETNTNGNYGESISGYGSGKVAALKAMAGNYYQQVLADVDAGISGSYTVNYDGGIRAHSSYPSTERDITLRVSLWDATDDVELVGIDVVTSYSLTATSLETRSHFLSYDNTGLAGHLLALRFANTSIATNANASTVLLDNVVVDYDGVILPAFPVAPVNGEESESIDWDPTLQWISGTDPDISEHVLYFGIDENWVTTALPTDAGAIVLDESIETYLYDDLLEYETTYFWRVDEATGDLSDPAKVQTGSVWSFTTRLTPPPPCAGYDLDGDLDGDCFVDAVDLMLLAQDWMLTSVVSDADINEDTNVDFSDFTYISRDWLNSIELRQHKIMFVSTHPDDEGIFFGGAIPYYAQVLGSSVVHISVTSGDWNKNNLTVREAELTNADEIYYGRPVTTAVGLVPDPSADLHFLRFRDVSSGSYPKVNQVWDWWYDGVYDGGMEDNDTDVALGKQKVVETLASYIRVFKPEVIATQDFDGEYGHSNHRAVANGVAEAYELAADLSFVDGNTPWLSKKLYVHQSEGNNGIGTPDRIFQGWLFHDGFEDLSIDTDGNGIPDKTSRQVADQGLDMHASQGRPDVSTVYRTGERFDTHHSEWWGLYRSTVGPDTIADPFTIMGKAYNDGANDGWSIGNFFENLAP